MRVRFTGDTSPEFRNFAFAALKAVTHAAGLQIRDVTHEPEAEKLANLEYKIFGQYDLTDNQPCQTRFRKWKDWVYESVIIETRPQDVYKCSYHEAMHAMGIVGHPRGRTVLSYWRTTNDALGEDDAVLLKGWYSPRMKPGFTAFEALVVLTDEALKASKQAIQEGNAMVAREAFLAEKLKEMERYAEGDGEVPLILIRTGKTSPKAIADGKILMAYYLASAHREGIGTPKDNKQFIRWLEIAAKGGNAEAKRRLDAIKDR